MMPMPMPTPPPTSRPRTAALLALLALTPGVLAAKEPVRPRAIAVANGVSTERLQRMKAVLHSLVDKGELPGLVSLVIRDGKVVDLSAFGYQDLETRAPMRTDSIFRIASMSKLVTSVAVMMLVEEGRFLPGDPVSRYLPRFAAVKVATAGGALVPPKRPITIEDLLTHRSGITYGFGDQGQVGDAYRRLGVADGLAESDIATADSIGRLAEAPLVSHPGEAFHYGLSTDVLGHLVEVVSGTDLATFFRTRIFAPLQMNDTDFTVSEAKWSRFATAYTFENGKLRPMKDPETIGAVRYSPIAYYRPGKKYLSGGAGLAGTTTDYARLLQMLANGGELDGVRILGPKTVEWMTVSHTQDLGPAAIGDGAGFGLGVAVTTDLGGTKLPGSLGAWNWGGIYGSTYWVDPQERLIGVLMAQRFPDGNVEWTSLFKAMVYQALIK